MPVIRDQKQFWSGLLFALFGASALIACPSNKGTLTNMGPGYFPMVVSFGLMVVGVAGIVTSCRAGKQSALESFPTLGLVLILGGVCAFELTIDRFGLALSLLILVLLTCFARSGRKPVEVCITYASLLLLTWVIFIYFVQLPVYLFWQ